MGRLIVMGASAGGLDALKVVLGQLPPDLPAPVLLVQHIGAYSFQLPTILSRCCAIPVRYAGQNEVLAAPVVLVAPPGLHMTVAPGPGPGPAQGYGRVRLLQGPRINYAIPAIDPLLASAAQAYGPAVVGVVLTGYLHDGAAGLQAIKACGGVAIVQDPAEAVAPDMPVSAIEAGQVDHVLPLMAIGRELAVLALDAGGGIGQVGAGLARMG